MYERYKTRAIEHHSTRKDMPKVPEANRRTEEHSVETSKDFRISRRLESSSMLFEQNYLY